MSEPDYENFAKAVLTDWPTGDLDGSVLFDLSLQYGMIQEVPGGYNSDHHIDVEGVCPEEGDPWYEYTFRGEAGQGLYSIADMTNRIEELETKLEELEPKDGRPCATDEFLAVILDELDDEWDVFEAIRDWVEGDWVNAVRCTSLAELKGEHQ